MNKWSQFRYNEQEIPETPYEACVFLSHATTAPAKPSWRSTMGGARHHYRRMAGYQ